MMLDSLKLLKVSSKNCIYLANQYSQIFRIRLHKLIKLRKLSRAEENLGHTKLEIVVIQSQSLKYQFNYLQINNKIEYG